MRSDLELHNSFEARAMSPPPLLHSRFLSSRSPQHTLPGGEPIELGRGRVGEDDVIETNVTLPRYRRGKRGWARTP